ncbi:hypothetical protein FA15DRAFT_754176 [Coprinopsis marcescibilis]|uniref:TAF6 C-terminal HEAT repeat domain-containing protein n=1 Tax=Coprinopsis marcescibilis TaxID=230819 RepID=A0A5C3L4I0_COPMA|nr:hypothetical protein FA15DRAFT_754176 [Coprinopsis marcescibilis]
MAHSLKPMGNLVLMDVVGAHLENKTLFVEPYLHQLLPSLLSTLFHSSLPPTHATLLRTSAAQTLSRLLTQHSTTYSSLSPRIMKTLLLALISGGKSKGTREGAVKGLVAVGKEAVRKGLVESGGTRVVATDCHNSNSRESNSLVVAVLDALRVLHPSSETTMTGSLDRSNALDSEVYNTLTDLLGEFFANKVANDASWAREIAKSAAVLS